MSTKYFCDSCGKEDPDCVCMCLESIAQTWEVRFSVCEDCRAKLFDEFVEKLLSFEYLRRDRKIIKPPELPRNLTLEKKEGIIRRLLG